VWRARARHGGTLTVDSTVDNGTTFSVQLLPAVG